MKITEAPKNILQIDEARIMFRNFAGKPSVYNREGDRNFALIIPDEETAEYLRDLGYHVKVKEANDNYEEPLRTLSVKVKFGDRPPAIYLVTNGVKNKLDEESVDILDKIDIINVDLDIVPYDWEQPDGRTGRTAYLRSICVTQQIDRFADGE